MVNLLLTEGNFYTVVIFLKRYIRKIKNKTGAINGMYSVCVYSI